MDGAWVGTIGAMSNDEADDLCSSGYARVCNDTYFCANMRFTTIFESKYKTTNVEGATVWCEEASSALRAPLFAGDVIPECKVILSIGPSRNS